MVLIRKWSHLKRRRAAALLGMAAAIQLLVSGILLIGFGLEKSLHALNQDVLLLPGGGGDTPGITDWLALSPQFAGRLTLFACIVLGITLLVFIIKEKGPKTAATRSLA